MLLTVAAASIAQRMQQASFQKFTRRSVAFACVATQATLAVVRQQSCLTDIAVGGEVESWADGRDDGAALLFWCESGLAATRENEMWLTESRTRVKDSGSIARGALVAASTFFGGRGILVVVGDECGWTFYCLRALRAADS